MGELSHVRGTIADLDFVTTAIVAAERSGTSYTLYERLFELTPDELVDTLRSMLREDIPGSELCCESFVLALVDGIPVGCIAAWIEAEDGPASHIVRANLISHTLGQERWMAARHRLELVAEIDLPREPGALQIEAVYVTEAHRGKGIPGQLIQRALAETRAQKPHVRKAQILSVPGNERSFRAFSRAGFAVAQRTHSDAPAVAALLPGAGRILWEKVLD
jgi:GNAT superfamily N-acetyltransferase